MLTTHARLLGFSIIATQHFVSPMADVLHMPGDVKSLEFVTIGPAQYVDDKELGNPGEGCPKHFGAVPYLYDIGKYEVTVAQYAEFLNAVAATDCHQLYNSNMTSLIVQGGVSGSYTYNVVAGAQDKPIVYVSWYDAARMANWLHNGQGSGNTEDGAYDLTGPISLNGRKPDACYFIPSEHEWYKAAYFEPHQTGGDSDDYWLYPTRSNMPPTNTPDTGVNIGSNTTLPVGSYGHCPSANKTFDMAGNVWERNEAIISIESGGLRGGACDNQADALPSTFRATQNTVATHESGNVGFRLARRPAGPSCPADLNGDGVVEDSDFVIFSEAYNQLLCP